jgi:hypothetical protein
VGLDPDSRPNENINPCFSIDDYCVGKDCTFGLSSGAPNIDSAAPPVYSAEPTPDAVIPQPEPELESTPEPTPEPIIEPTPTTDSDSESVVLEEAAPTPAV